MPCCKIQRYREIPYNVYGLLLLMNYAICGLVQNPATISSLVVILISLPDSVMESQSFDYCLL